MNGNPMNNDTLSATGYLSVAVRTAEGAIPIEGALVTVRSENGGEGDAIASFLTDNSGLTPRIYLPTAPRERSNASATVRTVAKCIPDVASVTAKP